MGQVLRMAKQARFAVVHRGDDIPGAAPFGDMVQRGDGPRHMGRLVVGGGACQPQANMLGVAGQQAEDWQRIEPRRILRTQLEGTRTGLPGLIADCQAIGKNSRSKQPSSRVLAISM
jgi:hypothetical protein